MFTGIVETTGKIQSIRHQKGNKTFCITSKFQGLSIGESIAVNGVCLTVESFTASAFQVTAIPETLRLTNLAFLNSQDDVNLERAMLANQRIGGHFMQGHVDRLGKITHIQNEGENALLIKLSAPNNLTKYMIKKGFIGIDGMSITLTEVHEDEFSIALIPHTIQISIAKHYGIGTLVNLEVDMFAKYLEKLGGKQ